MTTDQITVNNEAVPSTGGLLNNPTEITKTPQSTPHPIGINTPTIPTANIAPTSSTSLQTSNIPSSIPTSLKIATKTITTNHLSPNSNTPTSSFSLTDSTATSSDFLTTVENLSVLDKSLITGGMLLIVCLCFGGLCWWIGKKTNEGSSDSERERQPVALRTPTFQQPTELIRERIRASYNRYKPELRRREKVRQHIGEVRQGESENIV